MASHDRFPLKFRLHDRTVIVDLRISNLHVDLRVPRHARRLAEQFAYCINPAYGGFLIRFGRREYVAAYLDAANTPEGRLAPGCEYALTIGPRAEFEAVEGPLPVTFADLCNVCVNICMRFDRMIKDRKQ